MNIKPTPEQVDDWELKAAQYADSQTGEYYEYQQAKNEKFAELAAKWGAAQAQQATPEGFVRVPLVMTQAMEEVTQQEDWQWADLLAAAEAVTEEQYNMVQAQQPPVEEPELPGPVAARWPTVPGSHQYAGALGCNPGDFGPNSEDLYTATQMQAHYAAGVRAGAAGSQDTKRYRWLRQEHERIDPICRLSWKRNGDRNGQEWVNTASLDAAIDAAMKE